MRMNMSEQAKQQQQRMDVGFKHPLLVGQAPGSWALRRCSLREQRTTLWSSAMLFDSAETPLGDATRLEPF